jgi:SlyX protein
MHSTVVFSATIKHYTAPLEENMEERIERLESLVALQDRTIEKLSDSLFEQQQQIADMEKQIRRIGGKIRELDASLDQSGGIDAPPPHYNG